MGQLPTLRELTAHPDLQLGSLLVSPSRRLVGGPAGQRHLQPQIMLVLLCLTENESQVVTRRTLFERCWGNAAVGDDSLNRAIAAIRRVLHRVGAPRVRLETIPTVGYRLVAPAPQREQPQLLRESVEAAYDAWRSGLPSPDTGEIERLELALADGNGTSEAWGTLALLLRKAVEYSAADESASYVRRCEAAARRAHALDERESHSRVALAGLAPLFGNWAQARSQLTEVTSSDPWNVPARHDLAVLEMATGRPSAAAPLIAHLIAEDPYAATFYYKRMYHLWTAGDVHGAELTAARALQLWPQHPAIWSARFWILVFTERAEQAVRFASDPALPPPLPRPAADFLKRTAEIAAAVHAERSSAKELSRHASVCADVAARGPSQAVSALLSLCALNAIDQAFEVARGYYLGEGRTATPVRWNAMDPSITDQHRRVTQPLFIPSGRRMREDSRFIPLCEDMGLAAYWEEFGLVPDFLHE